MEALWGARVVVLLVWSPLVARECGGAARAPLGPAWLPPPAFQHGGRVMRDVGDSSSRCDEENAFWEAAAPCPAPLALLYIGLGVKRFSVIQFPQHHFAPNSLAFVTFLELS